MIVRVCASRDLKRELIRGYVEGKVGTQPILRPAGHAGMFRLRWHRERRRQERTVPEGVGRTMNDDQSPLVTLISCMVSAKTMKLETIAPDGQSAETH